MKSWHDKDREVEAGTAGGETAKDGPGAFARGSSEASVLKTAASSAKKTASETATAFTESAGQGLGAASDIVQDVVRNFQLEEMTIRGKVGGKHGFQVNIEDENDKRYLALRVDLRSKEGDELRVVGRKVLPAATEAEAGTPGGRSYGGEGAIEGRTSPTGRGGY